MTYFPSTEFNASSVAITGGTINNTTVGATTASIGKFTSLVLNGTTLSLGTGIGEIPVLENYNSSGLPGWHFPDRLVLSRSSTSATDFADFQFNRTTSFTGGSLTNINKVIDIIYNIGGNDACNNAGILSNVSTSGVSGGNSLGAWISTTRNTGATDHIWGALIIASDQSGLASSQTSATLTAEFDIVGALEDDATNSLKFGGIGSRHFVHFACDRAETATGLFEISNGLWFTTGGDGPIGGSPDPTFAVIYSVIGFGVGTQIITGLDLRGAAAPSTYSHSIAAVRCSAGQIGIDFNGGTALNSAPGNTLIYTSNQLQYQVSETPVFTIGNIGNFTCHGFNNIIDGGTGTGFGLEINTNTAVGISTTSGTFSGSAIRLAAGQKMSFTTSDSREVQYNTSTSALEYLVSGSAVFSITDTGGFVSSGPITSHVNVFTGTGNVTMTSTDNIIIIKKSVGAATTVTLPSSPATGRMITVKDGKGDSSTNAITISPATGTIDGAASITLNLNYAAVDLCYNGSEWSVL